MMVMKTLESDNKGYHAFVAAFVGGYVVFGKYNGVNEQVWTFLWLDDDNTLFFVTLFSNMNLFCLVY